MIHKSFWHFEDLQHLSSLGETEIYRTRYQDKPCLVRISTHPRPSAHCVDAMNRERDFLKKLNGELPFFPRLLKMDSWQDFLYILYAGPVETGLELWREQRQTGSDLLRFARELIRAVEQLHKRNIFLQTISPSGIFLTDTGHPVILGFDKGSDMAGEIASESYTSEPLSLYTLSPEMTGRTGQIVDYRSDVYSLGAILYFLLSGKFPIVYANRAEWIHKILTWPPEELSLPSELKDFLPPLKAIIGKTLEKDPERRYQNLSVLLYDWICLGDMIREGSVPGKFRPGIHDRKQGLDEPAKLYGREEELKHLEESFHQTAEGSFRAVLVQGGAGKGKTRLIGHFQETIQNREHLFLEVKFDQYKSSGLNSGLTRLFESLVARTNILPPEETEKWLRQIRRFPEDWLEIFREISPGRLNLLPEPEKGSPHSQRQDFSSEMTIRAVTELIRCLAGGKSPLVLFIDDLQWVDNSFSLFLKKMIRGRIPGLFLILTCREGENNSTESFDNLVSTTTEIQECLRNESSPPPFTRMGLADLSRETVSQIINDISPLSKKKNDKIVSILYGRTRGNPLFISKYIREINKQKLFVFLVEKGEWDLDQKAFANLPAFDTELDLVEKQIREMPENMLKILVDISQLKSRIKLGELYDILPYSRWEILTSLQFGEREGLLLSTESIGEEEGFSEPDSEKSYRFIHDKIKEIIYSFMDEKARRELHSSISGRLFAKIHFESVRDSQNLTRHLVLSGQRSSEIPFPFVLPLIIRSVNAHLSSQNVESALDILQYVIQFYGDELWESPHEDLYFIFYNAIESSFRLRQYEQGDAYIETVLGRFGDNIGKAAVKELQMNYNFPRGEIGQALIAGERGLKYLGYSMNTDPGYLCVLWNFSRLAIGLLKKKNRNILSLDNNQSEKGRVAIRLFAGFIPPAFNSGKILLFGNSVLKAALLSLRFGLSSESAVGFIGYAILLAVLGKKKDAGRYGELSLSINRKFSDTHWKPMIYMLYLLFCLPWKESWDRIDGWIGKVEKASRVTGEGLYRANAILNKGLTSPALTLSELIELRVRAKPELEEIGQYATIVANRCYEKAFSIMAGKTPSDGGPALQDEELFRLKSTQQISASGLYTLNIARIAVYLEQEEKYRDCLKSLQASKWALKGAYYEEELNLFSLILYVRLIRRGGSFMKRELYLSGAKSILSTFKKWAALNPLFKQHVSIAQALISSVSRSRASETLSFFDRAIGEADEHHFLRYRALFRHLAAEYCGTIALNTVAIHFLNGAVHYYRQYGAQGVIDEIRGKTALPLQADRTFPTGEDESAGNIDVQALLQASQSLAKEINLDQLIREILELIVQNCGASRGILILLEGGEPDILMESKGNRIVQSSPGEMDQFGSAFAEIVHETLNSMKTTIDNRTESMSRLCFPFISKQHVKALVYLENSFSTGIFTKERIQVLNLLSSAIIISLENARLYKDIRESNEELEKRVKQRTGELDRANSALIEKLKKIEDLTEDLTNMAIKDELTSLYNRRYLNEIFPGMLSSGKRKEAGIAAIMIDVDHFKKINDTFGHISGDRVLKRLALIFQENSRLHDHVFRLGGEEFMLLAPHMDNPQARILAEKIRRKIEEDDFSDIGAGLRVTVSLGVYLTDNHTEGLEEVLKKSDQALYEAKAKGRNRTIFYPFSNE